LVLHKKIFGLKVRFKSSKIVAMTIGEVARASGLRASAIRYYERSGLLPQPLRAGGQRQYDRRILERIALLQFAKNCGFTLSETRALFAGPTDSAPLSERLRNVAARKISDLDAEAKEIALRKRRIMGALNCRCADLAECGRRLERRTILRER
jgi:DNA-binding transcriptional MerR regulator